MATRRAPKQFVTIGAFGGDREDAESITLSDAFSVDGSRNVYMDKFGRATTILGYAKKNAAAVVSNVGAVAMRLRGLYPYGSQAGGVLTRKLIGIFEGAAKYEVWVSTNGGGTWSFVFDLGSTYVGFLPDFAQLGNELVLTFGTGSVKRFDTTGTLTNASSVQLAAPSAVATTAIGLLDGTYQWRVVPVKSDGTRKMASLASPAIACGKKQATLTWAADGDATTYEIYRTTGTGKVYFYEASAPAGTLTYTSNVADLVLISGRALQEYGDAPPSGSYFVEAHTQRLWYLRTDAFPRRIWPSDPGLPYSVNVDGVFFDCTDGESFTDTLVGGTGAFKGMFVGWLERSIWTISGKGRYSGVVLDYELRRTDAQTGTVSSDTVARIPAGSTYIGADGSAHVTSDVTLAYLTPLGDVRLFDSNNDTVISWAKQDVFHRLAYGSRAKSFVINDARRGEVTWVFPIDSATEPNYAVTWQLRTGMMVERQWGFSCGIVLDAETNSSVLLAGESSPAVGGFAYELWSGTSFDGAAIAPRVTTKTLYGKDRYGNDLMQLNKRWRYVELLVKMLQGTATLLVEWWPTEADLGSAAYGSDVLTFPQATLVSTDGSSIVTTDGSAITVSLSRMISKSQLKTDSTSTGIAKFLSSRGIRLRITTMSGSGQWSLVGAKICYQVIPQTKQPFRR